ncbi:hypothetical protein BHYA_0034g00500 [Botrytis hyacinthi]|uniref:Uncharacterized protein n=1 Tax=Botrytis hyacinthi TaxID=278943 RepID=A0A4Z1GZX8_9HELO|nr:hypothetical protein BHYA_0034g00500 [Botrytis hyacinthi]
MKKIRSSCKAQYASGMLCSLFSVHESLRAQLPGANHPRIGDIMLLWVAKGMDRMAKLEIV